MSITTWKINVNAADGVADRAAPPLPERPLVQELRNSGRFDMLPDQRRPVTSSVTSSGYETQQRDHMAAQCRMGEFRMLAVCTSSHLARADAQLWEDRQSG